MNDKISVIIPVRNEADKIEQCLKKVFSQSYKPFEIIIVDGHSTDETVEKAKKFPVRILYEDYHTRAGACQIGVENAGGDYVAFTDADCRPDKDWLGNLIEEFDEGIVGVGGGIIPIGEEFWNRSVNLALSTFMGSANSIQGRFFKNKRFVQSISGCNSMYHKKDVFQVGGFNVYFSSGEDTELNKRLLKIGKLLYIPEAIVRHEHGRGLKDFAKHMYTTYGRYAAKSNIWRLQVFVPLLLVPLLFISLIFTPRLFMTMLGIYFILIGVNGLKIALQERNAKYLFSIPIIYIIEHSIYSIAFWIGIIPVQRQVRKRRKER